MISKYFQGASSFVKKLYFYKKTMNSSLSILIVEDDISFAVELEMIVEELGYHVLGRVDNSAEALDLIFSKSPDMVLMDIDINGNLSGLEVGERVKHLNIPILFITSHNDIQTYTKAQNSILVGYLVKPIEKITLLSTINLFTANRNQNSASIENKQEEDFIFDEFFFFKKKGIYSKIKIASILFIESDGKYCISHTESGETFISRINIGAMEDKLDNRKFMRVHRKYIVNLSKIDAIDFFESTLSIESKSIPISRSNRKELENLISKMD